MNGSCRRIKEFCLARQCHTHLWSHLIDLQLQSFSDFSLWTVTVIWEKLVDSIFLLHCPVGSFFLMHICVKCFSMFFCWHAILTWMGRVLWTNRNSLSGTDVRNPPSCASLQGHRKNKRFQRIQPADRRETRVVSITTVGVDRERENWKSPKPRRGFWVVLMHVCAYFTATLMRLRADSSLTHLKEQEVAPATSLEDIAG